VVGTPYRRIQARSAELRDGEWLLRDAKDWPLGRGINAEGGSSIAQELTIPSDLTLESIRETFGQPSTISIWKLPEFIRQLERAGFSTREHRVWLHSQIARPLFLVSMVLIAGAFTMRHTRFGGTGIAVLAAVLLGFALYFVRSFAMILGENGQLAIQLAVWAPPVAAILLAFGPLLHSEDG
jgi:lipopolysaccharide export system permease protein